MGYIVDISKWNDNINWAVAAKNLDLAICRVQYGSLKRDKLYNQHVQKLEAYGVPHAAYAYGCYVSVNDAIVEAKDFMARVSPNARFLVLDVEDDTLASCGPTKLASASQAFIDTCKAAGWKVGLYVSHHMYEKYGLSNLKADFLWVPRYGNKPKYSCDLWQYADNSTGGYVAGIGNCDVNRLNGDKSLKWFLGEEENKQHYRIYVGDFNSSEWKNATVNRIKEILPGYGLWEENLGNDSYRIVVGDFNSKSWLDETFNKLKSAFPSYGMWIQEL
ncbi:GH25 family lysozyme [Bacillus toyonensis]|uniref:GH25 family lysozyme n=1 Tax=Bacillus toyonensis TaxID=155322 RepID=UPI000CD9F7A3|nr:GH25 family lysozyme [Bacillus toyonensis]MED3541358.1 GH25 family lysozyme [Bacillus toyonensis]